MAVCIPKCVHESLCRRACCEEGEQHMRYFTLALLAMLLVAVFILLSIYLTLSGGSSLPPGSRSKEGL